MTNVARAIGDLSWRTRVTTIRTSMVPPSTAEGARSGPPRRPRLVSSSLAARTRGVAAKHASLSRWRSPVRIRSGPPELLVGVQQPGGESRIDCGGPGHRPHPRRGGHRLPGPRAPDSTADPRPDAPSVRVCARHWSRICTTFACAWVHADRARNPQPVHRCHANSDTNSPARDRSRYALRAGGGLLVESVIDFDGRLAC
jgi:hypothetical protein